jgi:anti-anti-sigma regulatory factor
MMPSKHPCVTYGHDDELRTVITGLLAEDLKPDQQIGYFGWGDHRRLVADLRAITRTEAWRAGAHHTTSLDEKFDRYAPPDPDSMVAFWDDARRSAQAAGFSSLRAVMDTTPWLTDVESRTTFLEGDHLVDRYCLEHPFSLICVCDARRLDRGALQEITSIHATAHGPSAPFHLHATTGADFALTGEVDTFSVPVLDRLFTILDGGISSKQLVIDATGLEFVNHAALLTLERHAERMGLDNVVLFTTNWAATRLAMLLNLRHVRVEQVGRVP